LDGYYWACRFSLTVDISLSKAADITDEEISARIHQDILFIEITDLIPQISSSQTKD
ncbi:hypothetical protein ACLOJK_021373, partial [Asimina triloba]